MACSPHLFHKRATISYSHSSALFYFILFSLLLCSSPSTSTSFFSSSTPTSTPSSSSFLSLFPHVTPVSGMIDDFHVHVSERDQFFSIWSFEFGRDATYSLSLTLANTPSTLNANSSLQVLFCSDSSIDSVRSASFDDVCASNTFNYVNCTWQVKLGSALARNEPTDLYSTTFNYTIQYTDFYRLLVLNCAQQTYDLYIQDIAINPGGEYLSLAEVPYKKLFIGLFAMWAVVASVWSIHVSFYFKFNVALQTVMICLPISKALICIPQTIYWNVASKEGHYPVSWGWLVLITSSVDRAVWLGILWLIACGWKITRNETDETHRKMMTFLLVTVVFAYIIFSMYNGFLIFLILISYVANLRFIFIAIVENAQTLLLQYHHLQSAHISTEKLPLNDKLRMYKHLQIILVLYICIDVVLQLWSTLFLRSVPWASDLLAHLVSTSLCIALFYLFGLRPFNPYLFQILLAFIAWERVQGGQPRLPPPLPPANHVRARAPYEGAEYIEPVQFPSDQQQRQPSQNLQNGSNGNNHRAAVAPPDSLVIPLWRPGQPVPPLTDYTFPWTPPKENHDPILLLDNMFPSSTSNEHILVGQMTYQQQSSFKLNIPKDAYKYYPTLLLQDQQHHSSQQQQNGVGLSLRDPREKEQDDLLALMQQGRIRYVPGGRSIAQDIRAATTQPSTAAESSQHKKQTRTSLHSSTSHTTSNTSLRRDGFTYDRLQDRPDDEDEDLNV